ncbi:ATP-binding cassette domain-containing protein [Effusibacillus consociatus]|uniref:ATP-binding cassette domain-containing protein n=1 Tax=Effusibacillus consociatus TaxID=1117041 RepID=A0ABV9PWN0_9BACL
MIKLRNVFHSYRDGTRMVSVLRGVDLTIRQGEWVAITGANGSGKSTLIRTCNGLLIPSEGTVNVAGLDLSDPQNREQVKQKVQIVFQNPDAQTVGTTPVEDVAFGLENRGIHREEMQVRIDNVLRKVRLEDKLFADVATLSGGQKQRLAIASCVALEPDCLIFDEATSMLDLVGRKEVYAIARSLWKAGTTVIWVTQRLQELLDADRILVLESGQITYDGNARTLFYDSDIPVRCNWEVPPVIKIGLWLRRQGVPLHTLPLLEEEVPDLVCKFVSQA